MLSAMDTITITTILIVCGVLLGILLVSKTTRTRTTDRPIINIDFDTAKEREDKNRYFS